MNYTKSSMYYVLKNLWYLLPLSVGPAILFTITANAEGTKEFFTVFFSGNLSSLTWLEIVNAFSLFRFTDWYFAISSIFTLLAVVFCASLMLALIDKHMRIGKRTLNGLIHKLNDNVVSTFFIALLLSVIYEVWTLIFSSLTFVIFNFISILPLQYVIFGVLFVLFMLALLYGVSLIYLWLPCMQITGFESFEALRYSNQITEKVKWKIILSMAISLIVGNALIIPTAIFLPLSVVYAVMLLVFCMYFMLFIVRMEVIYFHAAGLEREDLALKYTKENE